MSSEKKRESFRMGDVGVGNTKKKGKEEEANEEKGPKWSMCKVINVWLICGCI